MEPRGNYHSEVQMEASADEAKELPGSPEAQFSDNAEALGAKIESVEEKITLCDVIFQDLLAVQRILKEKGLCDASFQEQNNQADFTL